LEYELWVGIDVTAAGGVGTLIGVSSSNACGAKRCKNPSYKALIASNTRMPGKNQFLENKMYNPTSQITACRLRHGPTNFFFGSLLLIYTPPIGDDDPNLRILLYFKTR
jgi:hypothetical protein